MATIPLNRSFGARRMHRGRRLSSRVNALLALFRSPHDVNSKDAALVTREQIIYEIADDGVRFVPELGHHAADESVAPAVPFQVDRPVKIARAMNFRPTMRAPWLFRPGLDKAKFFLQLWISRDLAAQRSAPSRDHLNHRLHSVVRFNLVATFAIFL
jgi:hypothetical protein